MVDELMPGLAILKGQYEEAVGDYYRSQGRYPE